MQIPTDLTPREAAEALRTLTRALEAHMVENGVPSSVALINSVIAGTNAWRGARGLPAVAPWMARQKRPALRLVEPAEIVGGPREVVPA